ncbi:MAG TPA: carboxypeptidase-like regulatory domain-containing protein [Sphingomicrobium sp.]
MAALAALGYAAAVGASSATPAPDSWAATPDDQFLLDVKIRQYRLGDGVRAYNTPTGTCIIFGDIINTLDVPLKIDLAAKKAGGWAFKESNRIELDYGASTVTFGGKSESLKAGTIRETPEGWCVNSEALSRWLGIGVRAMTSGSVVLLESANKLPVELAMERQERAKQLKVAKFDLAELPQVRLPYRMWRAPALDFVVSAGATYRASDGVKVDRRSSVLAAGEIARLSYEAQLSTNDKGRPSVARFHMYRSDPEGELLGPLQATHFGFGDVSGISSRLSGNSATGRGAVVTNRPLFSQAAFDRTRYEGDLPIGWEAEIYRNGELLAFAKPTPDQRYVFDDVQLLYGDNQISVILYGPQGQVRTRQETVNVGQDNVPAGKTWYWAGFNQPGRDLAPLTRPPDFIQQPTAQATVALEHGLDARTSVGALARMMLVEDERVTVVEGSVRRSFGKMLTEVTAARETSGGMAFRAQMLTKVGSVNISADLLAANDFHLRGGKVQSLREARVAVDAPLKLGRTMIPLHGDVYLTDRMDGSRQIEATTRASATFDRVNVAGDLRYRKQLTKSGPSPPGEFFADLIGTGHVGDVRLRGGASFEIAPRSKFSAAEVSAYWSGSEHADWEGGLAFDAPSRRGRARLTHVRRLNTMAIGLTGEAATDGSVAFGVNLSFSIDPGHGLSLSRRTLAGSGAIRARVYRDLNDNGRWDREEPAEKGALVVTGSRTSERTTDARGAVLVGGLAPFNPISVGLDTTSLADPMLVPKKPLQVVVPRPGVPALIEIGLVGGGDVEGALVKSGGSGMEGLMIDLVDASGKTMSTAQTDFDGFFLFERVPYGKYRIRVQEDSAVSARVIRDIAGEVLISPDRSVVRLGSIPVDPVPLIATAAK